MCSSSGGEVGGDDGMANTHSMHLSGRGGLEDIMGQDMMKWQIHFQCAQVLEERIEEMTGQEMTKWQIHFHCVSVLEERTDHTTDHSLALN